MLKERVNMRKKKALFIPCLAIGMSVVLGGCYVGGTGSAGSADTSAISSVSQDENGIITYSNEELGFAVDIPSELEGKLRAEVSEREAYGETITTVSVYYMGETGEAHIMSFEEMSEAVWKNVQGEGGPLGDELGVSKDGRVVIINTLQSNPYAEGTVDYEELNKLPKQISEVKESFRFLDDEQQ